MDTLSAFAMNAANQDKESKVFDWDKAARLIKERNATSAEAGLAGDWEYTGGSIFSNGEPDTDSYTFLSSTWATPQIEIDGESIDCYVMESAANGWDEHTKWPVSALAILKD